MFLFASRTREYKVERYAGCSASEGRRSVVSSVRASFAGCSLGLDDRPATKNEPAKAANPATNAPIKPVANTSNQGLLILRMSKDTRVAKTCSFVKLMYAASPPQHREPPSKPAKADLADDCLITTATMAAAIAILHQGKNNPAAKASNAVMKMDAKNFIGII